MVFIVMLLVMFFVMFGDTLSVIEPRISEKWDAVPGTLDITRWFRILAKYKTVKFLSHYY